MELHEAVKKARKQLGLSQQKLAELAGIERKQLSILENGGNVTLATIRKIVAHLPNMEPFTLNGAVGEVFRTMTPEQKVDTVRAGLKAFGAMMQSLLDSLSHGRLPDANNPAVDGASREFYRTLGFTNEEYDREALYASQIPQPKLTKAETAAAVAELVGHLTQLKVEAETADREGEEEAAATEPPEAPAK